MHCPTLSLLRLAQPVRRSCALRWVICEGGACHIQRSGASIRDLGCSHLQRRNLRTRSRKPRQKERFYNEARVHHDEPLTWVLVTLSGQTLVSSGHNVWCGIAEALKQVDANIEDAAGQFMQVHSEQAAAVNAANVPARMDGHCVRDHSSFELSAFNTHITPYFLPGSQGARLSSDPSGVESVAVSMLVKATVPKNSVSALSDCLHTKFPQLAVSVAIAGEYGGTGLIHSLTEQRGVIHFFGNDRAGQLAEITKALHESRVAILDLEVKTGHVDSSTCDFVESIGGSLAENVITFAPIGQGAFDEVALKERLERVAEKVGYKVMSLIVDGEGTTQESRAQKLAKYHLRRRAFIAELSSLQGF